MKFRLLIIIAFTFCSYIKAYCNNIFIDAKKMDIDLQTQIATYIDNVVVKDNGKVLECDKMEIFYSKEDENYIKQDLLIKEIFFHKNVVLSDKLRVVNADEGIYKADERMVYLWGNVKVKESGNFLEAEKVKYDMKKEFITIMSAKKNADGKDERVRIIIDDEDGKAKSK